MKNDHFVLRILLNIRIKFADVRHSRGDTKSDRNALREVELSWKKRHSMISIQSDIFHLDSAFTFIVLVAFAFTSLCSSIFIRSCESGYFGAIKSNELYFVFTY